MMENDFKGCKFEHFGNCENGSLLEFVRMSLCAFFCTRIVISFPIFLRCIRFQRVVDGTEETLEFWFGSGTGPVERENCLITLKKCSSFDILLRWMEISTFPSRHRMLVTRWRASLFQGFTIV